MNKNVKAIPDGFHSATPYLTVRGAAKAIDFYTRALGAREKFRMPRPDGKIAHAEVIIGDSTIMLADENPAGGTRSPETLNGTASGIFLYVQDVDATFERALQAGAKSITAPQDMFWGDRFGVLTDPFGHQWMLATHIEDVSPAEMEERMTAATAK
jgi:PhnB protein